MSREFSITEVPAANGAVILRVAGHLDSRSAPELSQQCRRVRGREQNLILNLSEVTFIASSGVGSLLALVEEFGEEGLTVSLVELSPAVDSVIKLLNLDRFLIIRASETDATADAEAA